MNVHLEAFETARREFVDHRDRFVALAQKHAFAALKEAFPTLHVLKVEGDDEGSNFTPRLRVKALLDEGGNVLFDVEDPGEGDEDLVDEVGIEILDWIIDHDSGGWYGATEIYETPPDAHIPVRRSIDIVFDGPPGAESGRFVETETPEGKGVGVGEWVEQGGYWRLRITGTFDDIRES